MEVPDRMKRGKPQRKFMDVTKEAMQRVAVTQEDSSDTVRWRKIICCGDPQWEWPKEEEADCVGLLLGCEHRPDDLKCFSENILYQTC